ncbi:amino acid/polyamine transporter I [Irpex rosettiformis]|uniref:Amino acid/polyamine transporter I n=1 Tax=Irpex rosettiformis TaxID=378272 RepID=A0ACB8U4Z7_9APHY|nr:amino acid/polyamine transporter I [Irpex rosettiformis]
MEVTTHRRDAQILAGLGYKQELHRAFTPLEVFGIAFSIIGLVPSIASTIGFALPNGGPGALVWGWAICATMVMFTAMALGELSSAAPTSGGLYFWTFKYASSRYRKLLSWIVGYSNTMGSIAGAASVQWGCAVQLVAAVSIGSGLTFTATSAQIYGVYVALLVLGGIVASTASALVARLQGIYTCLNLLLCLALIIALPISTPSDFKNDASYVFSSLPNLTTWPNGFAFVLSFLAPLWTIGGFDGPIHISEEASNARTAVPWAIVSSVGVSGLIGWGINVVIAFNMGKNMENIMASSIGQPMATIFFNSFGTRSTLAIWSIVVAVQFTMATSALVSTSRQIFAFSRDGALPFSRFLYRINPYTQTPANCVWASVLVAMLLGLLAFAGSTAINAIFSIGIIGQYVAFALPVASRLLGGVPWTPGPFNLKKLSIPVAITMIAWSVFSMVIVMFPSTPDPTATEMNYTVVVGGGWLLLCVAYYYLPVYGGRHWFVGPISNIEPIEQAERRESLSDAEKASVEVLEK